MCHCDSVCVVMKKGRPLEPNAPKEEEILSRWEAHFHSVGFHQTAQSGSWKTKRWKMRNLNGKKTIHLKISIWTKYRNIKLKMWVFLTCTLWGARWRQSVSGGADWSGCPCYYCSYQNCACWPDATSSFVGSEGWTGPHHPYHHNLFLCVGWNSDVTLVYSGQKKKIEERDSSPQNYFVI